MKNFENTNDAQVRKSLRKKMRNVGLFVSDYGISNITTKQFNNLFPKGKLTSQKTTPISKRIKPKNDIKTANLKQTLITEEFTSFDKLNQNTLSKKGLYLIQLNDNAELPKRYQTILYKRNSRLLYNGKAQNQSLANRLGQEIEHKKPGTFFRSIGAVLNKKPISGHLKGNANQNNYKFPPKETKEIINWLKINVKIAIIANVPDFSIEKELIEKHTPLLNDTHNPLKLQQLKDDKAKCRVIARGI